VDFDFGSGQRQAARTEAIAEARPQIGGRLAAEFYLSAPASFLGGHAAKARAADRTAFLLRPVPHRGRLGLSDIQSSLPASLTQVPTLALHVAVCSTGRERKFKFEWNSA